jgi:hypothetical protein
MWSLFAAFLGQSDNRLQMPCFEPLLHGPSPISLK